MKTVKEIGKIFRGAREKRGLSVQDVCDKTQMHVNVISDIENGVFDRLGKLYMKSFLKKYAKFLELNENDILKKYEELASSIPGREFSPTPEGTEDSAFGPSVTFTISKEKMQIAFVAVCSVVFLVLVFMLFGMLKSRISASRQHRREIALRTQETQVIARKETAAEVQTQEKETAGRKQKARGFLNFASPKKAGEEVVLTLKARGEVWIKVTRQGDTLFAGILEKGDTETWKADGTLNVWTGKAENLSFRVNTYEVGRVAAGVVKNIKVSSSGIKIGDAWVTRFD